MKQTPESPGLAGVEPAGPCIARGVGVRPYYQGYGVESSGGELSHYVSILLRYKWAIFVFVMICLAAAALITRLQTRVYKATSALEIADFNLKFLNRDNVDPVTRATGSGSSPDLEAPLTMLRSRSLIRHVISTMDLEDRPEYSSAANAGFRTLWGRSIAPRSVTEALASKLEDSLEVSTTPGTHVIQLTFRAPDPKSGTEFLNTLMQEFIDRDIETRLQADHRTTEWLGAQAAETKVKLQNSEDELEKYKRTSGLMFTDANGNVAEEKLNQIQEQLSTAEADRIFKQARFEAVSLNPQDALPETIGNTTLNQYEVTLTNLRQQLADAEAMYTPNHYKVKQILAQVEQLTKAVSTEKNSIIESIQNDYQSALRRQGLLLSAFRAQINVVSEQDAKAIHYSMLKREVDTNRQLYDSILQTVKEAKIASALRASNIEIIEQAEASVRPFSPKPGLNLSIGFATGLFFGTTFALIRARNDSTFRRPGEISACLDIPELGAVPSVTVKKGKPQQLFENPGRLLSSASFSSLGNSEAQSSSVAEALRTTLASILFRIRRWEKTSVIVWTSPSSGEGKTTSVANMALAMAMTGRRVLLIDADMRKPRLHELFGIKNDTGLSELLARQNAIDPNALKVIQQTHQVGLQLLTAGSLLSSAADLLYSPRLAEIISLSRGMFDAVFVDTPPILKMADGRIVASLADAVVLVCRAGETHREAALIAAQRLKDDGIPILGTILNDWAAPSRDSYLAYDLYRTSCDS